MSGGPPERERVLLTGATGFVGSHIAGALCDAGHGVRCTIRRTSSTRWLDPLRVETVEADLGAAGAGVGAAAPGPGRTAPPAQEATGTLREALREARVVVHAAGVTRAADPETFRRVNAEGTLRLARAAAEAGVRRFVFISSLAARGPDGASGPDSPYGRSKREAEEALARLDAKMEIVVLRPGGVYGPRDTDMVPLFRLAARGWIPVPAGGRPIQPVYATDVARAALLAAGRADPGFGPFPVAGRERHSWEAVRAALERALGRRVRLVRLPAGAYGTAGWLGEVAGRLRGAPPPFDRRRARDLARHSWTCDVGPTERALGWRPEVELVEGLERTVRWYRAAGWMPGG